MPKEKKVNKISLISFGSLLAYSAYVWLLKVRPAAEVGVLLGNENVSIIQLIGLIVILLGMTMINRKCLFNS